MTDYLEFGTPISFGFTAQYLDTKTCTRRDWKDSHAAKFVNAYDRATAVDKKLLVPAIDKGYHAGGKQIGWCEISDRPYKERLEDMLDQDLPAEGGMSATVADFILRYFKGKADLQVWVIRFEFYPLTPPADSQSLDIVSVGSVSQSVPKDIPRISEGDRDRRTLKTLTSAKSDEHNTPKFLADAARAIMGGIDLDPMSNTIANRTIKAHQIYTKVDDGLQHEWLGRIWLNPPFSLADEAVAKLIAGYESGAIFEAILLIKSAPDTKRHQSLYPYPFCDLNGRVKFEAEGNNQSAPFATTLFYLGSNFPRFRQIMSDYGRVHPGARLFQELEGDRAELLARLASMEVKAMIGKKETISEEINMSSAKTGIEWTDRTWNPVTGCDKISPGCTHCYAEALTKRFHTNFPNGFDVTLYKDRLDQPSKWKKPSRIFVNSMSDLFHDKIPFEFIRWVFWEMEQNPRHTFQILTKRHHRLFELAPQLKWPDNVWMGVSVENQDYIERVDALCCVPAKVRLLSCEPLLGPLKLDLTGIHWVIVGGESGQRCRPIKPKWVRDIRTQCQDAEVPFFFKQWGGRTPKANGRLLDGQIYDEMPT